MWCIFQRFAFSPLLDEASEDEEEIEQLMGGPAMAADTKHRGKATSSASSPRTSHTAVSFFFYYYFFFFEGLYFQENFIWKTSILSKPVNSLNHCCN